ncbi:MAG: patatin-like phospholipase family protein [Prosthecobacter sp.]
MSALAGKRVAISLGASFMGYATHAGFLATLSQAGVKPVALGGSSAGAIAAGLHAAGLSTETIREAVLGTDLPFSFIKGTPWGLQQLRDIFTRCQPGLFDPSGAVSYFQHLVGDRQIEHLNAPRLLIAMTDIASQASVLAQSGPLARAMAASCTVPLIFSPLEWQGRLVSDGGVVHEAPVDPWFTADDIDVIFVHRIHQPEGPRPWLLPLRMIHTLAASHHCVNAQWMTDRTEMARLHGKQLVVLNTISPSPSIFSRASREACYAAGEAAARACLG